MAADFGLLDWVEGSLAYTQKTWSKGRQRTKVNDDVIKLFLVYLSNLVILGCIGKHIVGQWPLFSNPLTYGNLIY